MPSRWLLLGAITLTFSCAATSRPATSPPGTPANAATTPAQSPKAEPTPSAPPGAPTRASRPAAEPLEKSFTGQAQPSLTIKNGFPTAQHLFIDWALQDVLAPGATQTLTLSPGPHTITSAESADPDDHAAAVTESFEAGYAYRYEIMAR